MESAVIAMSYKIFYYLTMQVKFPKEKKYNSYDNYVTLSKENATKIWYKEY